MAAQDIEERLKELKLVIDSMIAEEEAIAKKLNHQSYFRGKAQAFREVKGLLDLIC